VPDCLIAGVIHLAGMIDRFEQLLKENVYSQRDLDNSVALVSTGANVTLIIQLLWFLLEPMTIHSILRPRKVQKM
jgi:hypothetical protein